MSQAHCFLRAMKTEVSAAAPLLLLEAVAAEARAPEEQPGHPMQQRRLLRPNRVRRFRADHVRP
jgi:hypothetical protein